MAFPTAESQVARLKELLDKQPPKKLISLFKSHARIYETRAGVILQRIPGAYLYRILQPLIAERARKLTNKEISEETNEDAKWTGGAIPSVHTADQLYQALYNFPKTFTDCISKKNVDVLASAEVIAQLYKTHGSKSMAQLVLAWKPPIKENDDFNLVGVMTVCRAYPHADLSTDRDSFATKAKGQFEQLEPHLGHSLLIDALCSKEKGVGTALVLDAIRLALVKNFKTVLALSFSSSALSARNAPASFSLLTKLGFKTLIEDVNYNHAEMHGHWMRLQLDAAPFYELMTKFARVCARTGFTDRSKDALISRCPG